MLFRENRRIAFERCFSLSRKVGLSLNLCMSFVILSLHYTRWTVFKNSLQVQLITVRNVIFFFSKERGLISRYRFDAKKKMISATLAIVFIRAGTER